MREVRWDGISQVVTKLQDGQVFTSDKMLVAVGRQANIEELNLSATGLIITEKGTLAVNEHGQTAIPHIYVVAEHSVLLPDVLLPTIHFQMEFAFGAGCLLPL